ncbi:MAG: hypothetical protein M3Q60_16945, partial [Actinomycetota bacterium]|nr:hypothetical protein [Actinomycetota bacterium]
MTGVVLEPAAKEAAPAMPKSANFASPPAVRSTFWGFTSRWTMPRVGGVEGVRYLQRHRGGGGRPERSSLEEALLERAAR